MPRGKKAIVVLSPDEITEQLEAADALLRRSCLLKAADRAVATKLRKVGRDTGVPFSGYGLHVDNRQSVYVQPKVRKWLDEYLDQHACNMPTEVYEFMLAALMKLGHRCDGFLKGDKLYGTIMSILQAKDDDAGMTHYYGEAKLDVRTTPPGFSRGAEAVLVPFGEKGEKKGWADIGGARPVGADDEEYEDYDLSPGD